jgi:hypothetical protein
MSKRFVVCLTVLLMFLSSCELLQTLHTVFWPPEEGGGFTFEIGPAGGSAYDPTSGASLLVPAGALAAPTEITCKGFVGYADFNAAFASSAEFVAGARLEPDGLEFDVPVTLNLPINVDLAEMCQDTVPLFVWDADTGSWVWAADAVVNDSREFLIASVSHFSTYAALQYPGGQAVRSMFLTYFGSSPAGDSAGESTVAWWMGASSIMGRNHTIGGDCYKAVGTHCDLAWAIDKEGSGVWTHYEGQVEELEGATSSSNVLQLSYFWDNSEAEGEVEHQSIISMLFTIYLEPDPDCTLPNPYRGTHSFSFTGDYYGSDSLIVDEDGGFFFHGTATSTVDSTQQSAFDISGSINATTGIVYSAGVGVTASGTMGSSGGGGTWTSTAIDDEGNVLTFSGTWTSP